MTTEQVESEMHGLFAEVYRKDWERVKSATLWQSGHGERVPLAEGTTPDWEWSVDFGRWGASVRLANGWVGFTFPAIY